MEETPNVNDLIDYSRKDKIVKMKSGGEELKTQYEGRINEASLDKLASTLQLNAEQIKSIRNTLTQIIKEVKSNYLNPYQEAKVKQIEMRYDDLMRDLRSLSTVAATQLGELLGVNIGDSAKKIVGDKQLADYMNNQKKSAEYYAKFGVEPQPQSTPNVVVSQKSTGNKVASNSINPYPQGSMMGNQWEKVNAGK